MLEHLGGGEPDRPAWSAWRTWPLWSVPTPARTFIIATVVVAHAATAAGLVTLDDVRIEEVALAGLLMGLGIVHTEILVGVERVRKRATESRTPNLHTNLSSVWTFAGAMLLPAALSAAVVFVIMTHLWVRTTRPNGALAYRAAMTTSSIMCGCIAAARVLDWCGVSLAGGPTDLRAFAVILLAGAVYSVVNIAILTIAVVLSNPTTSPARVLGSYDHVLEGALIAMGAVIATLLAGPFPWMMSLTLPVLFMLHRALSSQELERDADRDLATGLLNGPGWHREARRELRRAARRQQSVGLLLLDLDGFRRVNEQYGHLAGNAVLAETSRALTTAARDHDLIGRHGGEEFVVLLPAVEDELMAVAEQLQAAIVDLAVPVKPPAELGQPSPGPAEPASRAPLITGLTVTIGVARFPDDGMGMEELLAAADRALRRAKQAGTGEIACSPTAPGPWGDYRRSRRAG